MYKSVEGAVYQQPEPFVSEDYKGLANVTQTRINKLLSDEVLAPIINRTGLAQKMRWKPANVGKLRASWLIQMLMRLFTDQRYEHVRPYVGCCRLFESYRRCGCFAAWWRCCWSIHQGEDPEPKSGIMQKSGGAYRQCIIYPQPKSLYSSHIGPASHKGFIRLILELDRYGSSVRTVECPSFVIARYSHISS